jgi:hypothetical protein
MNLLNKPGVEEICDRVFSNDVILLKDYSFVVAADEKLFKSKKETHQ